LNDWSIDRWDMKKITTQQIYSPDWWGFDDK